MIQGKRGAALAVAAFGICLLIRPVLAATDQESVFVTGRSRQNIEVGSTSLSIAPESRGIASSERAILQRGELSFTSLKRYRVETATFRIAAPASLASGTVRVNPDGGVEVSSIDGLIRVENNSGVELARLLPGESLAFQVGGTEASKYTASGCLSRDAGNYILMDATAKVKVQVRGQDLARHIGRTVRVTGNAATDQPPAGVTRIVDATDVADLGGATCGAAAASHHTGVKAAVIGGVAVGGVVGGLYGAGAFDKGQVSPSKP